MLFVAVTASSPVLAFDEPYRLIGVRWNVEDGPVPFALNKEGSDDIEGDGELDAVRDAFRAWACVPGSLLRFAELDRDPPKEVDLNDGVSAVFWDETGEFGMGAGTLGITIGNVPPDDGSGELFERTGADIVFNGRDSTWSAGDPMTDVDTTSIAVHEIGHLLGLDHPCAIAGGQEVDCNGPERSVMTPAWGGGDARAPLPDDVEGLLALYAAPAGDTSTCEGPFRKGERCGGDCECTDGLLCVPGLDDVAVCATTCTGNAADCGDGFACVLGAKEADLAPGVCVKIPVGSLKPIAAACGSNGECEDGLCLAVSSIGRSVCKRSCDATPDCGDGLVCADGACASAGGAAGTPCEEVPGPCGCDAATQTAGGARPTAALVVVALFAATLRRRRGGRS